MGFMDALILIFIVRAIINVFGASRRRSQTKSKNVPYQTQAQPRTPRKKENKKIYDTTKKTKKAGGFSSILTEIQKEIDKIEAKTQEFSGSKKTSYAETVVNQDKSKEHILKPQVLTTERNKRIEDLYEGMGGLAEDRISVADMEDYQEALYGDSDEDSLFDYDSAMEIDAEWDSEEGSGIVEILEDKDSKMDLKTAVIFREILDKPIGLRK